MILPAPPLQQHSTAFRGAAHCPMPVLRNSHHRHTSHGGPSPCSNTTHWASEHGQAPRASSPVAARASELSDPLSRGDNPQARQKIQPKPPLQRRCSNISIPAVLCLSSFMTAEVCSEGLQLPAPGQASEISSQECHILIEERHPDSSNAWGTPSSGC